MSLRDQLSAAFGALFVMYLVVASNYVGELFNCDLQQVLQENYWIKHLLGYMTLFFFVNLTGTSGAQNSVLNTSLISLMVYAVFIITNRAEGSWQVAVLLLLLAIYLLEIMKDEIDDVKTISQVQVGIGAVMLATSFFGFVLYVGRKRIELDQEGTPWSWVKFFKGTTCRHDKKTNHSVSSRLKRGFSTFAPI